LELKTPQAVELAALASLAIYAVAITLSFWKPRVSRALCAAVALLRIVPDRRIESRLGS
jgi:hypothetical protein